MPRMARVAVGDTVYHVLNRSNGRVPIFHTDKDYLHFESLLYEAKELTGMRLLSYCLMPNHWHLVVYPTRDTELGEYMRWLTTTHVRQYRVRTESIGNGHLYQGRYKSFPVEVDSYLTTLIRYIEQNPLRAKIAERAEDWKWSSLWRREKGSLKEKSLLSPLPTELPINYLQSVNELLSEDSLQIIRHSVNKEKPLGSETWVERMVQMFNLQSTIRTSGRPKRG